MLTSALIPISGFPQFGSRDGSRGSESSSGMVSVDPLPKAEAPAFLSRTASKGMFGAHPGHAYGDPPGPPPAQLFQESELFYLAQESQVPSRVRAPRLPEPGGSSRAGDSSEGYKEEGLEGRGEKPPTPGEQPGNRGLSIHSMPMGLLSRGQCWEGSVLTMHALVNLSLKSSVHSANAY